MRYLTPARGITSRRLRFVWAALTSVVVESALLGVSGWIAIEAWRRVVEPLSSADGFRGVLTVAAAVPAYLLFAVLLLVGSAVVTRLLGWRTPAGVALRLDDYSWALLDWGRYLISIHVARALAGPAFRSTPVWTAYMRLNGARIGRGVWVNSLSLMDHNLLTIGDGAVVGSDAHVSGHTVERGILFTAPVVIGAGATVGVGSVIAIGVTVGAGAEIGALAVVPKFTRLETRGVYVGSPVREVSRDRDAVAPARPARVRSS